MLSPYGQSGPVRIPEVQFYGSVRRACDCCRRKKIRCDTSLPCGNCRTKSLTCTYLHSPKMKGREKSQDSAGLGSIFQSNGEPVYEGQQRLPTSSSSPTSLEYQFACSLDNLQPNLPSNISVASHNDAASLSVGSPVYPETYGAPGLVARPAASEDSYNGWPDKKPRIQVSIVDLLPLIEMYFDHLFPIMPVLDRNKYLNSKVLEDQVALPPGEHALLTAVSALTIVQLSLPGHFVPNDIPTISAGMLIEECLRTRHSCNYIENPNLSTVLTSFFLFGYYGNLEKHNQARHFLHEAISFAEAIKLDDEVYLSQLETRQEQWYRRTFWLLFITERYMPRIVHRSELTVL
jgi:hypothetical protein